MGGPGLDIVMATCNGAAFLGEQLTSLQQQTFDNWRLWVRDDASTDATPEILRRFAATDARIRIVEGPPGRLGACANFAWLLSHCPEGPYVLCADQDDWWLPEKLAVLFKTITAAEKQRGSLPLLVASDLAMVDRNRQLLADSYWQHLGVRPPAFRLNRLLVRNPIPGCALMVNRAVLDLALPIPSGAVMHDWWLVLTAALCGALVTVPRPLVHYRQHQNNWSGGIPKESTLASLGRIARISDFAGVARTTRPSIEQAQLLRDRFAARLAPEALQTLRAYAELLDAPALLRKYQLVRHGFFKCNFVSTLAFVLRL